MEWETIRRNLRPLASNENPARSEPINTSLLSILHFECIPQYLRLLSVVPVRLSVSTFQVTPLSCTRT